MATIFQLRGFSHQRHALAGAVYYRLTAFAQERMASQDTAISIKSKVPEVGRARWYAKRDMAIDLGRKLLAIKAELPHGHFMPWVRDKSGLSYIKAQRYMRLAREAG
ncbi:DUF3102 domain-containing protein [Rhizobium leguminosarum]|uniref:DUF3102 domain-containing protein n=1 Tax=Rhizobium leguminosarum TaxID=384 RepID=UPI003F9D883F